MLGRACLFLLGYSRIDSKCVTPGIVKDFHGDEQLRLQRYRSDETDKVQPGDLILVNHSSYIDLIVLNMMFSARFTKVSAFPPHRVYESSVVECLTKQDGSIPDAQMKSRNSLKDLLAKANTPIVVFLEGTRTNGRALLRFVTDLSECTPNQRIHVVSLRHDNFGARSTSPTFPVCTFMRFISHFWAMLNQWDTLLGVKVIPPIAVYKSDLPNPPSPEFKPALEKIMLEMTPHVRSSRFNMVEKLSFLRAFLDK